MPWDPLKYNQFQDLRNKPFFDLMAKLKDQDVKTAIDLGCGTGVQTAILADHMPDCQFLGIDHSKEMLSSTNAYHLPNLVFKQWSIQEAVSSNRTWDLVFSNAALQWVDNHESLWPQLIQCVSEGGQLAVQMPCQLDNVLNQMLLNIVSEQPFKTWLDDYLRPSPVLSLDQYATMMFEHGLSQLDLSIKVYPMIVQDADELYRFIEGTAMIPYLERLNQSQQQFLKAAMIQQINQYFNKYPAIYAFKRLLLYGVKAVR